MKEIKKSKEKYPKILLWDDIIFSPQMAAEQLSVFIAIMRRKSYGEDDVSTSLSVLLKECGFICKGEQDEEFAKYDIINAINILREQEFFLEIYDADHNNIDLFNYPLDNLFYVKFDSRNCLCFRIGAHGFYIKKDDFNRMRNIWIDQSTEECNKTTLCELFLTYSYFMSKICDPYGERENLRFVRSSASKISLILRTSIHKQREYIKWLTDNGFLHSAKLKTQRLPNGSHYDPGSIYTIDFPEWKEAIDEGMIYWEEHLSKHLCT